MRRSYWNRCSQALQSVHSNHERNGVIFTCFLPFLFTYFQLFSELASHSRDSKQRPIHFFLAFFLIKTRKKRCFEPRLWLACERKRISGSSFPSAGILEPEIRLRSQARLWLASSEKIREVNVHDITPLRINCIHTDFFALCTQYFHMTSRRPKQWNLSPLGNELFSFLNKGTRQTVMQTGCYFNI